MDQPHRRLAGTDTARVVIVTFAPRSYPLFLTMARTGMRIGEALALQWDRPSGSDRKSSTIVDRARPRAIRYAGIGGGDVEPPIVYRSR